MESRHLIAYALILVLVLGGGALIARAVYFSRARVAKRRRHADRVRRQNARPESH